MQCHIMENKKEKYYNFIIDDLLKGTIINGNIFFHPPYMDKPIPMWFTKSIEPGGNYMEFRKYMIKKYGIHEDEVHMLFLKFGKIIEAN